MTPALQEQTRSEWRELGFFYDVDDGSKEWRLVGSRAGLERFAALLRGYVADPRNEVESEHEHYGPYMYLKVVTQPDAGMNGNAIHGPISALSRLAILVEQKLSDLKPGQDVRIREEYASTAEYALVLDLRDDGFDPASADPSLLESAG